MILAAALLAWTAAAAPDAGADPRLGEAQAAYDEAVRLRDAGKLADAVPKAERAFALREAALGGAHVEVARSLTLTGDLYRRRGDYARAEPLLQRGLSIREAALGRDHPDVADSLNRLGYLYFRQGLYDRAEPLFQRGLSIREAALGKDHLDVADSLNNLGLLYWKLGRYDRAEPLHQRALAIRIAALGKVHPSVSVSLCNLALLYNERGQYDQAEALFEQALEIDGAVLGKAHPNVANSLNNLATIYAKQGRYERAEALYQRALAIREAVFGKEHPDVAASLYNLAQLYSSQGQYVRAEELYRRALAIEEVALGKSHPDLAYTLDDLANLYFKQGRYEQAEPLHVRALAIEEAALGKDHPDVAGTLQELANLSVEQGQYGRAGPLFDRALAIREAALGDAHPLVGDLLGDVARLRLRQRRLGEATPLLARALAISEGRLRVEGLDFSEERLAAFLKFLGEGEQRLYSLARAHPGDPGARRLALTAALLFRGRSVEEAADTSRTILKSLGPGDREVFERLRGLRTLLAKLSLDGPGELPPAEYRKRLKELAEEGDRLQEELARHSAPLRAKAALPSSAEIVERVAAALPRDGVFVQLVAYGDRSLTPGPGIAESKLPVQPRYLALALFPDGRTGAADLGPAPDIDAASLRLRDVLASREATVQAAAQRLHQLAFKPLVPLLGKARRVFLAPDGQLALVPFAALHDGRRFLADTFDFTYLTSGRDLLPRPEGVSSSASVVVLADPDYGAAPAGDGGVVLAATERSSAVERFFARKRAGFSERRWASLPGTREEAEAIQRLLPQAQVFVGAAASKERLLQLSAPGILHIATHGFFLEDAAEPAGGRGLAEVGGGGSDLPDPLLRSGLVLAGAGVPESSSQSLVTALELAGIDLWGTELVVLSACDTGRGDVKLGQGVYGLRRALVVAGAETLVVSLWKVDDETTRAMMESYYRNLLAGQGRAAALRQAMLSLRARYPHPHDWAPFIAVGRDAPLRTLSASKRPE